MALTLTVKGEVITVNDSERTSCECWTRVMGRATFARFLTGTTERFLNTVIASGTF
jgi:hypothetical protein